MHVLEPGLMFKGKGLKQWSRMAWSATASATPVAFTLWVVNRVQLACTAPYLSPATRHASSAP
jgi:hypothetical protein